MDFLLDANAVSDLMVNHPDVTGRLDAVDERDDVLTCIIVRGEVLFGIERIPAGRKREQLRSNAERVFGGLRCEAVPDRAAEVYARIKQSTHRRGTPMGENDLWIAATALVLSATLVTRDGDFANVPGLTTEDWTKP